MVVGERRVAVGGESGCAERADSKAVFVVKMGSCQDVHRNKGKGVRTFPPVVCER